MRTATAPAASRATVETLCRVAVVVEAGRVSAARIAGSEVASDCGVTWKSCCWTRTAGSEPIFAAVTAPLRSVG